MLMCNLLLVAVMWPGPQATAQQSSPPTHATEATTAPAPTGPDDGTTDGSTYVNRFFGIRYTISAEWVWFSPEAMARLRANAQQRVESKLGPDVTRESNQNTHFLAVASSSPPGSMVMLMAEDLLMQPGVQKPEHYLDMMQRNSGMEPVGERKALAINGTSFLQQTMLQRIGERSITHVFTVTLVHRFALALDVLGLSEPDLQRAMSTLANFHLEPPPPAK